MSGDTSAPYALLLQDITVRNESDVITTNVVKRGSLLARLSQEEVRVVAKQHQRPGVPVSNYKCLEDPSVKLHCTTSDVQLLNVKQKEMLYGVASASGRYDALRKLKWAETLTEGSTVFVNIPAFPTAAKGTLHYIGSLPGETGIRFGVELLECKYHGTSNGKFKDKRYFNCEKNCGIFVGLDKISERRVTVIAKPSPGGAGSNYTKSKMNNLKTKSEEKREQKRIGFESGDRVMAFDDRGGTVYGTVRWTGGGTGRIGKIVGIETDVPIDAMKFEDHVTYLHHYFTPSDKKGREYQLFLPFTAILKDTRKAPVNAHDDEIQSATQTSPANHTRNNTDHNISQQQVTSTDSPSGTPSAQKKHSTHLFDHAEDDNELFRTSKSELDHKSSSVKVSEQSKVTSTDSPGGTPSAKKKQSTGLFDLAEDDDGLFRTSKSELDHKSSLVIASEQPKKASTDSPSGTPSAIKKPTANQRGLFDDEDDEDEVFRTSKSTQLESKSPSAKTSEPSEEDADLQLEKQSVDSVKPTHSSTAPSSGGENSLPEVAQLHEDLKTLESQIGRIGGNYDDINSTVKHLHQSVDEMEKKFTTLQTQLSYYQQKTEESIQKMVTNVDNAFRKALEVQKNYEQLQERNAHLEDQLSLTQQQLLGVQSMMTCSRWWVVSHDQFTIGREIGRGAWAAVHEATFRGAKVAAKCLHQLLSAPSTRQLFQREMEMALHCQHQNVVTFLGATLEGHPVILMELMDTSLRSAYEQGHIKDHQMLGILYDTASALHFLHTRPDPVIHRDVSSANVLLKAQYSGEWVTKLGDLGTAKLQRLTSTAGPGAIIYGAPEAADAGKHSPKMDVYSFGVLVVETVTKTLPFENLAILIRDHVQQQFPWYHQVVTSCINQKSSDRPAMYDVIKELDKIKIAKP